MNNDDRPFYGNGTRWQNVFGNPVRWWQISYDTSHKYGRAFRNVSRLIILIAVVWFLVLVAT